MPDIKLKNGSGIEQTYTGVDTITVPLADGTGNWTFGLTDEELTFECADDSLFTPMTDSLLRKYVDRVKLVPATYNGEKYFAMTLLVDNSSIEDLSSITIDCEGVPYFVGTNIFRGNIKKLPKVINNENTAISNMGILHSDTLTEHEMLEFLQGFAYGTNYANLGGSQSQVAMVPYATMKNVIDPSEVNAKWHEILNHEKTYKNYSSNPTAAGINNIAFYTKSLRNIPIQYTDTTKRTSSFDLTPKYASIPFCDSFAFATDNGTPYAMNWKSMVIAIGATSDSYSYGYDTGTYSTTYIEYAQGFWKKENNIFTSNSMTIDEAKARYDQLKDREDWYSCTNNNVTYDGKSLRLALLFSRYNHDSAVETINSLPDTSAYLASAGGTNTIKFRGYSGALTDGGAINTLTEEEIAVAAAKGWTVSFV